MFMLKSHLMPHLYWHGLVKVGGEIINIQLSIINNQLAGLVGGSRSLQETIQLWTEITSPSLLFPFYSLLQNSLFECTEP